MAAVFVSALHVYVLPLSALWHFGFFVYNGSQNWEKEVSE